MSEFGSGSEQDSDAHALGLVCVAVTSVALLISITSFVVAAFR